MCIFTHTLRKVRHTGRYDAHLFKLNKSITEGISSFPVSDDLTATHNRRWGIFNSKELKSKHIYKFHTQIISWRLTSPFYGPKARKNYFQVLICGDWVQFAHKQHILRRPYVCIREVTNLIECVIKELEKCL